MTFRVGIVAHTARFANAEALSRTTDADFVNYDTGVRGCEGNHRDALERLHRNARGAQWLVILEDDAVPVTGFRDQLDAALITAPAPIVSLYLGRSRPPQWQPRISDAIEKADANDASWILSGHLLHAVGYAVRTELAPSLLGHVTDLPIDQSISVWARHQGHQVAYSWPSLVQHQDGPTLISHRDGQPRPPGRIAHRTGTRETWTSDSVAL
ncbi:hypothetical protein AWB98_01230 [Mycolicibacterium conceptionense]|uniref:Glycosyltransferase n=1 Tax=Mycolicibacterium conceptionense TaxID=451644 RepID=A0ABX3UZH7_9MYCO|nr:hypothetical protein [Mycolicibacterium conceptionense]ORV20950.1 hypothetical protein AWB98_01230 [Mycolicibacterium conceptionense]